MTLSDPLPQWPEIHHHGAVSGVTGSCHELRVDDGNGVLIDCGLFQGAETSGEGADAERLEIEFPIDTIRALLLTHCHIDHVGRIPYLLAAGFKGPIYCSIPTGILLPLVLEDALKVGFTRNWRLIGRFLKQIHKQLVPLDYRRWSEVPLHDSARQLQVKFQPAGHILGSSYIECQVKGQPKPVKVVFSGDLGATYAPLLPAPRAPYSTDILVMESTYGDREHSGRRQRKARLKAVVERCAKDRGVMLIPAFSIGRTQELLYELEGIIHLHGPDAVSPSQAWEDLEIIVDSPLASRFTEVYRQLSPYWDKEARRRFAGGRHPLSFEQLTTLNTHAEHLAAVRYLKKTARPTIVIAASGMCAGGRIVNYLKALVSDPRTDVLFVGYQARGTPGRIIQTYGPRGGYVELNGKRYDIRAGIHTLSGYSAHADRRNLINFVMRMRRRPQQIRLLHGDPHAKQALKRGLVQKGFSASRIVIPGVSD
jgi:metallo-beta-lactamase family protein